MSASHDHRWWIELLWPLRAALEDIGVRMPKRDESRADISRAIQQAEKVQSILKSGKDIRRLARPLLERIIESAIKVAKTHFVDEFQRDLGAIVLTSSILIDLCDRPNPKKVLSPCAGGASGPKMAKRVAAPISGNVLVVDDKGEYRRRLLVEKLRRAGAQVEEAVNGEAALRLLRSNCFDLILLDVQMPVMDGYKLLGIVKQDPKLRDIPVIMLSASDFNPDRIAKAIEMGAEDYLTIPYNSVLLSARVNASLEKHSLRVQACDEARQLEQTIKDRDALLRNIFPPAIVEKLNSEGRVNPVFHPNVTICFTDFVGFSNSVSTQARTVLITRLDEYFSNFDDVMGSYGLEKLKTIGDSYMFAGGLPNHIPSSAVDSVLACFDLIDIVQQQRARHRELSWDIRIGLDSGPVVAGVVGKRKYAYDVWGATVNFASRMESGGAMNQINVSAHTHSQIAEFFDFDERGSLQTKDGRFEQMYFVRGIKSDLRGRSEAATKKNFAHQYLATFGKELSAFPQLLAISAPAVKATA